MDFHCVVAEMSECADIVSYSDHCSIFQYYNNALIIYNDARVEDALNYLKENMKRWKENAIMNEAETKLERFFQGTVLSGYVKSGK